MSVGAGSQQVLPSRAPAQPSRTHNKVGLSQSELEVRR